jgi:hypothetical protein
MLRRLRSFWRAVWGRSAFERDMDDEMRFHIETRTADLVKRGLPSADAARQARIEFGNPVAWETPCRQARQLHVLDDLQADIRFALRGVRRHPLLSATVVLTLTLGIGVSCGVFTLFSAVALRPAVDSDADSFIRLYTT